MFGNRCTVWNVRAMPSLVTWFGARPTMLAPRKRMLPSSGSYRPVTTLNIVLLPAPLGPITETISPGSTWKVSPDRAYRPPKCLATS